MRNELKNYYESELTFLRQMGTLFAEKHPKIASRLLLDQDRCEDPHVERILEAFAFLAARVHLRIDDDFPQITEALLNVLYPHYLRPVPSLSIAEFHTNPDGGKLTSNLLIPKGTVLYSRPVEGVACKFLTCYDTLISPLKVVQAEWLTPNLLNPPICSSEAAVLRIELECFPDVTFDKLEIEKLAFYLNGEGAVVHTLYELLCKNCTRIVVRDPEDTEVSPCVLPVSNLRPLGFGEDEGVLPYPKRSFVGYRLLQEYFAFPEKFFFLELSGLAKLQRSGLKSKAEILFLIAPFEHEERHHRLEAAVGPKTVRLGCAPIVNLFRHTVEGILVKQTRHQYPIVPDERRRHTMEVYSVDDVAGTDIATHQTIRYQPLYSQKHSLQNPGSTYWYTNRVPSERKGDEGTDVLLSLVDRSGRSLEPDYDTITVRCTCTNRDLVSRLPFGNESGDFEVEGAPAIKRIVALHKPTPTRRPPLQEKMLWHLISQLSLNYLSLGDGKQALQKILELYDFSGSPEIKRRIAGISSVKSHRHFSRVVSENGVAFARGTRIEVEFDEEQYAGGGAYLFASVLERFFGLYVSMNSFSQLVASTRQRKELLGEWPPRAGNSILI